MAKQLTRRQRDVLSYIVSQIIAWGYPPTLVEIGKHMKIASTNGVRDHILVLERKGFLLRKASRARGLLPVWEKVEALGLPCPVSVKDKADLVDEQVNAEGSGRSKRTSQTQRRREIRRVPIIGTAS